MSIYKYQLKEMLEVVCPNGGYISGKEKVLEERYPGAVL
jgi:hypothetical protein